MSKSEEGILPLSTPPPQTISSVSTSGERRPKQVWQEITVFVGEFIGTFMFLFLAFAGTQVAITTATVNPDVAPSQNPVQEVSKLLYVSLAFGVALAVNASIFADISGAMFNPAVTSTLLLIGAIKWQRALHTVVAQILAGITSAFVVSALLPGTLPSETKLEPNMSVARGLFLEMFLTAQLALTIILVPNSFGGLKAMIIGAALFVCEICGVFYTGGSVNPARSFGPAVVVEFPGYHWIYWLGPEMGAVLAAGVFWMLERVRSVRRV